MALRPGRDMRQSPGKDYDVAIGRGYNDANSIIETAFIHIDR